MPYCSFNRDFFIVLPGAALASLCGFNQLASTSDSRRRHQQEGSHASQSPQYRLGCVLTVKLKW